MIALLIGNSTQPTSGDVSSSIVTTPAAEPTPADDPEEDNSPLLLNITLSWEIPATREDGSALPLNEIGGYEITYLLDGQLQHFSINDAQTNLDHTDPISQHQLHILYLYL